jgi:proteasome lid subunit RPN8/RPN11
MRTRISRSVLEGIRAETRAAHPLEACGLLFGDDGEISGWAAAANVAAEPEREFEIDPVVLFAALRAERAGGARVVGYWHSHPGGDVRPSAADAAAALPDGKLWVIVGEGEIGAWRAGDCGLHGRFKGVEWTLGTAGTVL